MEKGKVLQVIYTLNAGGIETFVVNLFSKIDRSKVTFDFAVIKDSCDVQFYDEKVNALGGVIIPIGTSKGNKIKKYFKTCNDLKKLVNTQKYDVIHIHSGQVDKIPHILIAKKTGAKVIVHSHNQGLTKSVKFYHIRYLFSLLLRSYYRRLGVELFACSEAAALWSFGKKGIMNKQVKIVNNGIDCSTYTFNIEGREKKRIELGLSDKFIIGHIGRFNYQKNHDFIIEVFDEIVKRDKSAFLLLIGTGERENEMRQKVHLKGLDEYVCFFGTSQEIPQLLWAMDVFLFPSHFEGLPVVGVETQAASLKTIASDAITKELKFSEYMEFESLNTPKQTWADRVLKYRKGYERCDSSELVKKAGFDMNIVANNVLEDYLNK